jgi:hypothetical protein
MRFSSSEQKQSGSGFFNDYQNFVQVHGGTIFGTAPGTTGPNDIAPSNPVMAGLPTTDATNARNLLNFMAASLGTTFFGTPPISQFYFLTDPNQTTDVLGLPDGSVLQEEDQSEGIHALRQGRLQSHQGPDSESRPALGILRGSVG